MNSKRSNPSSSEEESIEDSFLNRLSKEDKLKEAVAKELLKTGTVALEKFRNARRIVEERVVWLRIVLDVEEKGVPLVEVSVDDQLLGYINEEGDKVINEKIFTLECYKRGDGKWGRRKITVSPVRDSAAIYFPSIKRARFAPVPDNSNKDDSNKLTTVYIPIRRKRIFGIKIRSRLL